VDFDISAEDRQRLAEKAAGIEPAFPTTQRAVATTSYATTPHAWLHYGCSHRTPMSTIWHGSARSSKRGRHCRSTSSSPLRHCADKSVYRDRLVRPDKSRSSRSFGLFDHTPKPCRLRRRSERSLPQSAGTVRADAEVQTRAGCEGGGGCGGRTPSRSPRCDRLAKDQPAEITMFQISEVQESPAFNGRRSFLTLRHAICKKQRIQFLPTQSGQAGRQCAKISELACAGRDMAGGRGGDQ